MSGHDYLGYLEPRICDSFVYLYKEINISFRKKSMGLSIKGKLLIFGLCISLIPIAIITSIYYFYSKSVVKQQTLDWLTAVAESRKAHVLAYIEEERDDVVDASNDMFIKNTLEAINHPEILIDDAITNLNKHFSENKLPLDPSIVGIALLDTNGNVVASTSEKWLGKDMSGHEAFEQAIGLNYADTFTGKPHYSPELDTNITFISVPIISKKRGKKTGIIINAYDSTAVIDGINIITKEVRTVDFSSDGFIRDNLEVINRGISHTRKESIIALSNHLSTFNKKLDRHIAEICVTDPKGVVVGCTSGTMIGKGISDNELLFLQGLRNVSGETYIGQSHYISSFDTNGIPISTPVISGKSGEIMGIIIYTYYLAALSEVTTNRAGMGETGEVYLVNSDGMMLTESRFIEDTPLMQKVDTEPIRKVVEDGGEMTGIYPDYRGVSIVGASMYLPEYGWTLLAEIDKSEAFAPLRTLGIVALVTGLISSAVVVGLAIIFAIKTTRPIRKLTDATTKFAGGDLKSRVIITRSDEMGKLANSFNDMAEELEREISERKQSEEQLAERAAELSEANASLEEKNKELGRFNKVFVERELRIKELRDRIKKLEKEKA